MTAHDKLSRGTRISKKLLQRQAQQPLLYLRQTLYVLYIRVASPNASPTVQPKKSDLKVHRAVRHASLTFTRQLNIKAPKTHESETRQRLH